MLQPISSASEVSFFLHPFLSFVPWRQTDALAVRITSLAPSCLAPDSALILVDAILSPAAGGRGCGRCKPELKPRVPSIS
jgi:hypothetical protein